MKKEALGTLLAVLAAIVSGFSIPANKVFIVNLDPVVFTAIRSVVIGIVFLVLVLAFDRKKRGKNKSKENKASWKYLAAIAVIGGAIAFAVYFTGLKLTTAGHAAFLHKTLPLYVAVLAFVFLKEKMSRKYVAAMALMIVGTIAIYASSITPADLWSSPQFGDLLVVTAAFLWAVENVIARKVMKDSYRFIVPFSRMFFGGLILFGIALLMGKADAFLALTSQQLFSIFISTALLFFYVLFYYGALRFINVSKAAVFLLLAPVVSLALGIVFLNEPAPLLQIAGSAVILIGAYFIANIRSEERGV